jgi:NAD(P)H-hydrate epimerase
LIIGDLKKSSVEAKVNYELCRKLEIPMQILYLSKLSFDDLNINQSSVFVDALFGIGFNGQLSNDLSKFISCINKNSMQIFSIDIASGIEGNTGKVMTSFEADYTLTMAAPKYGHFIGKGFINSGEVHTIPIGIPTHYFDNIDAKIISKNNINLPIRNRHSHKGDYGRLGIIAGSRGLTGAAIMSSRSALKSGTGLITLYHPNELSDIFEITLTEVMTKPLKSSNEIFDYLSKHEVILLGPGLGKTEYSYQIVKNVINNFTGKLVIDADGLNILSENIELLNSSKAEIILTPHLMEFSRLSGVTIDEIDNDPLSILKSFCSKYSVSVLLKNFTSIFCANNQIRFITTGNDGLSTGGSGDVLAGLISSFLAQKSHVIDAVPTAAWVLGKTSELLSKTISTRSIIPSDIIENLFLGEI